MRVEQERRFLESLAADKLKEEKKMETERARLQILEQEEVSLCYCMVCQQYVFQTSCHFLIKQLL